MKKIIIATILMVILGCTYSVYSSGMPHLKKIKITEFENKTKEYELEAKLLDSLSDNFIQDGRLRLADLSPDCLLTGEIIDYSNKLTTYGSSGVDEYEVRILFSVEFTDLVKNEVIWKSSNLVLSQVYSNDETTQIQSEEDAIEEIQDQLFERILRESLEEW